MKRVLHVVSCLSNGGTEAFIMNNYRQLDKNLYQFDFLVFNNDWNDYVEEIKKMGGNVYFLNINPSIKQIHCFIKSCKDIMDRKGPYDVVHSHVNNMNGWVLCAAKKAGIPIRISHSHDIPIDANLSIFNKVYKSFERYLIIKNSTIFAACSSEAALYLYGKDYYKDAIVIPNGIDVKRFIDSYDKQIYNLRNELNIRSNSVLVGNITRIEDKKNSLFTIKVFSKLQKMMPNSVLIMGGDDAGLLKESKNLVNDLGIEKSVFFIGRRNDIPAWLQLIDIYLFPSKYEGLPIAFLEAQASGCLSVASTAVPKEADMGIGNTMFLDLKQTPDIWAKKIVCAYKNYKKPSNEKICKYFKENGFDMQSAHKKLVEIYN